MSAREIVQQRDAGRCQKCGQHVDSLPYGGSQHHRRARGMGGVRNNRLDVPSNLVTLCGNGTQGCHGWIEHHRQDATRDGWLISKLSVDDPESIPLLTYQGWVYLLDGGSRVAAAAEPGGAQ